MLVTIALALGVKHIAEVQAVFKQKFSDVNIFSLILCEMTWYRVRINWL